MSMWMILRTRAIPQKTAYANAPSAKFAVRCIYRLRSVDNVLASLISLRSTTYLSVTWRCSEGPKRRSYGFT
jgi:hypothetical protein